jgi:integrase
MSIQVKPVPNRPRKFSVYIYFTFASGEVCMDRRRIDAPTLKQATKWAETREQTLREAGPPKPEERPVMTVAEFAPTYVDGHLRADLKKRSSIDTVECLLAAHILPFIGTRKLDRITDDVIADLKSRWTAGGYTHGTRIILGTTARKTINNRLSVLGNLLRTAVDWSNKTGLQAMPCRVKLLKVDNQRLPAFHDHQDYARLIEGARGAGDPRILAMILLAGDAGLRCGEIIGLDLADIDFKNARLTVRRSVYVRKGVRYVDAPKGLLAKPVPIGVGRLLDALKAVRHLRGERVFYMDDGSELTQKMFRTWVLRAQRKAGLPETGLIHILRHTFASHAAMAGVPMRTIQGLARHASPAMTARYMHLTPFALDDGIAQLQASREAGGVAVPVPGRASQ